MVLSRNNLLRWFWLAACAAVYISMSFSALRTAYTMPYKNWDMIAYIGTMYMLGEEDQEKWYAHTMDDIEQEVGPHLSKKFRQNPLSANSEAFRQHMPFYKVKPGYVAAVYGLYKSGVPPVKATYMVSILSVAGLLALLFFVRPAAVDAGLWWLACSAFFFKMQYPVTALARLSTPDSMSLLVLAALVCNLIVWRKMWLWYALSALMVLVRPDTIVLMIILAGLYHFRGADAMRFSRVHVAATALGLVFLYLLVSHLAGAYDIRTFLQYSLIKKVPYPEQIVPTITLWEYFAIVRSSTMVIAKQGIVLWMLGWTAFTVIVHLLYSPRYDTAMRLMAASWIYFIAKVFTFGQWDQRFYYGSYFLSFVAGMMLLAPFLESLSGRAKAAVEAYRGR